MINTSVQLSATAEAHTLRRALNNRRRQVARSWGTPEQIATSIAPYRSILPESADSSSALVVIERIKRELGRLYTMHSDPSGLRSHAGEEAAEIAIADAISAELDKLLVLLSDAPTIHDKS